MPLPERGSGGLLASGLRFAIAGTANTAVGLGITLGLQFGAGVPPHLANAAGYAAGLFLGFVLSRRFVFRAQGSPLRYGIAVALAFALNQVVLAVAGRALGDAPTAAVAAQVLASASYTVLLFMLSRVWVFAAPRAPQLRADSAL